MADSPRAVVLEEEGLHEPPTPELKVQALMSATTACTDLLRNSLWNSPRGRTRQPLKRTAYLDGLRGFAALLVYCLHHQGWGHTDVLGMEILENAWGWNKQHYFVALPGVRIFFAGGHFAVAVFFVISGYVLSSKPLTLIHAGETTQLADTLGSALFRRWLRLFIPVIVTTFFWMTSWHVLNIRSSNQLAAKPESTYSADIWRWYCGFKNFSFMFNGEQWNDYNDHTWTIPMEFRGSVVVYTALLAFSRCRRNIRLLCEAGLIFYFLYIVDGWFCALFCTGMFLCDLDLLASKNELPLIITRLKPLRNWGIFYIMLGIGVYLGGVPSISGDLEHLRKSPGWYYLSFLKPQAVFDVRWFFRFWAGTFTMISVPRIKWLKGFFETPFCQYLGRISFAFYLIHGPILWTLGDRLYAASGRSHETQMGIIPGWANLFPFPKYGPFGLEMNFLLPQLILLPFTLWLAEIVTKLVDEPSVRVSQWLYNITLDPGEVSEKTRRSLL